MSSIKIKADITYRNIDEARIKQSEAEKDVKIKGLENDAQKENNNNNLKKIYLIIWALSLIVLIYLSVTMVDNVNFSPFQLILILDIILGYKLAKSSSK